MFFNLYTLEPALFRLRGNRAEVMVPVTALLVRQFHPAGQQRSRPAVEERRHAEDGAGRQGRSTWGSASSRCGDPCWTGQVGGLSAGGRHLPGAAAVHSDTSSDTAHCGVNSCAQFMCLSASWLYKNIKSHLRDPAGDPFHACRYTSPATPNSQLTSAGTSGIHSKNLVQNPLSVTCFCLWN